MIKLSTQTWRGCLCQLHSFTVPLSELHPGLPQGPLVKSPSIFTVCPTSAVSRALSLREMVAPPTPAQSENKQTAERAASLKRSNEALSQLQVYHSHALCLPYTLLCHSSAGRTPGQVPADRRNADKRSKRHTTQSQRWSSRRTTQHVTRPTRPTATVRTSPPPASGARHEPRSCMPFCGCLQASRSPRATDSALPAAWTPSFCATSDSPWPRLSWQ